MTRVLRRRNVAIVGVLLVGAALLLWWQTRAAVKPLADAASWFKVHPLAEGLWRIDDHGGDNAYLVAGNERALLIDTGTGAADLAACVRGLTRLPLTVVNTHGPPAHAGGDFQFEAVHASPNDFEAILRFANRGRSGGFDRKRLVALRGGEAFELGGLRIEVIETPGHSRGSLCLLDAEHKRLFAGDNDNTLVWLFLRDCLPLETYLQTLLDLQKHSGEFQTVLPGHGEPLDGSFVGEQIACAQAILSGTCEGVPYRNPFGIAARSCSYRRASIAFDPGNLRAR